MQERRIPPPPPPNIQVEQKDLTTVPEVKRKGLSPKARFGWLIAGGVFSFSVALASIILLFLLKI